MSCPQLGVEFEGLIVPQTLVHEPRAILNILKYIYRSHMQRRLAVESCAHTCSAMAYTCGLSSPKAASLYWDIMRFPYRCFSALCGFTYAAQLHVFRF